MRDNHSKRLHHRQSALTFGRWSLWFCLLLAGQAHALEAGGHLKGLSAVAAASPSSSSGPSAFLATTQRLDLQHTLSQNLKAELALDNLTLYRNAPAQVPLPSPPSGRFFDLERSWAESGHLADTLQIDRLLLRGRHGPVDWSVGRQAIGFGRIVLVSPLDVINPFSPDAIDTDVRPGVDAARASFSLQRGGQFSAISVFDATAAENSYLLTFADTFNDFDLLALAGSLRSRGLIGAGIAGDLGPLGVKVECTAFHGHDVGTPGADLRENFWQGGLEVWYRFDNGLNLLAEALYNGVGSSDPNRYPQVATSAPLQEGLSFLLGQHYLLLSPSWEAHPLLTLSALLIWNLDDGSSLLRPLLSWSLADDLSLDLFYAAAIGDPPRKGSLLPRSEFGSVGDSGGILLRWYF